MPLSNYWHSLYWPIPITTQVGDPIRSRIVAAFAALLATITIAGGYKTDIGNNVSEWRNHAINDGELPAVEYRDEESDPEEETVGETINRLTLYVEVTATGEEPSDAATTCRYALADILEALRTDDTFGGLAGWSVQGRDEMESKEVGKAQVSANMRIEVVYPTARLDAYNA